MQTTGVSRILASTAVAVGALAALLQPALAQDPAANYPSKPIRLIVPFAAGGGNDIFARLITAKVSEYLGQQFVIENRAAAGGRPAADFVANQATPDGYTMFIGASGVMSVAAAIYPKLPYHPTRSFRPLTMIADFPLIVVSPAQNPAKTVSEIVAYAKANPDKANYGFTSPAFIISTELLKLKTGMPGVGIPLKSSAEMVLCVIQQNCLIAISDGPPAIPQIKAGKVRALAVTGSERSPELSDVPSMAEAGYPEVNTKLWSGFFVPVKTPAAIAAKLEAAFRRAIADPGVNAKLRELAVTPRGGTGEEFRQAIDTDIQNYVAVVKAAKLKFE